MLCRSIVGYILNFTLSQIFSEIHPRRKWEENIACCFTIDIDTASASCSIT
jgi:hypothetical protein